MPAITIGRLRGGFCVYWDDQETGKRRRYRLGARTRTEAEAEAAQVYKREVLDKRREPVKVAEIWEDYILDLGKKPTAKTMKYTGIAVLGFFGAFSPDAIDRKRCRDYQEHRYRQGVSQGTVHTELGHLTSALNWAHKVGMIERVPYIWRPAKPETDKRILSRDEAQALIEGAIDPHIRLALVLLLGTGARVGAILDLTWDRVDFEAGSVNLRINDSATRKGRANVPMNKMVRAALQTARPAAMSDFVIEYAGKPIKSIRNGFKAAVRRAEIGELTIHEVRHTAAVTMLSNGVPLEKVSQMLGHSNTAITFKTYARYLPSHMQDAADILDFSAFAAAQKRHS